MKQKLLISWSLLVALNLVSCNHEQQKIKSFIVSVPSNDTSLHLINGVLYSSGKPFYGEVRDAWPNGEAKSNMRLTNGKQQGLTETFYSNGDRESTRWYNNGEKDSVHTGWWENGIKKYEYHFDNGLYNGLFTEWYQSGTIIQQVMYAHGKELYGKGWRETGKLYMNFVMKDGRRYGMNNSNLCYEFKDKKSR